jgi:hypothetical protein
MGKQSLFQVLTATDTPLELHKPGWEEQRHPTGRGRWQRATRRQHTIRGKQYASSRLIPGVFAWHSMLLWPRERDRRAEVELPRSAKFLFGEISRPIHLRTTPSMHCQTKAVIATEGWLAKFPPGLCMPFKITSECVVTDKDRCKRYAGALAAFPQRYCRKCCLQRLSSLCSSA